MLNEKFYIQLKKFLKRQGITQAEIAERYGTTQAYINLLPILIFRLFVYNHNSAAKRINHRQHLFHSRSATILEVNDGGCT